MINKILEYFISRMISSENFNSFIQDTLIKVYKEKSLTIPRIWGDESRISIGKNVHLNDAIINTVSGKVVIDDESFLGHGVSLLTGHHNYDKKGIKRQASTPDSGRDIIIGKGVWIASNAIVIGPCEIGDHSVVASGSIISGEIKSKSIYAGSPAKFIRFINFHETDKT